MAKAAARTTRKRSKGEVILNLETVKNPTGRVDVLAARVINRVVETKYAPLVSILEMFKPVLHRALHSTLGPRALPVGVRRVIKQVTSGAAVRA